MAILFVSGLVFVSECFNTAVEYLSDQITDEENENIRKAKDVAAAGVLISAIISVIDRIDYFSAGDLQTTQKMMNYIRMFRPLSGSNRIV